MRNLVALQNSICGNQPFFAQKYRKISRILCFELLPTGDIFSFDGHHF
jgi:hypothetical protein